MYYLLYNKYVYNVFILLVFNEDLTGVKDRCDFSPNRKMWEVLEINDFRRNLEVCK